MTDLVLRDPFRSLFNTPRWFDDWDTSVSRGLKIREDDKNIYAEAVVAGVPAEDVDIEIEDGVLAIKAEKKEEKKEADEQVHASYKYYYTCALQGGQWDKADADIKDGVVTITIPKSEATRPRKIAIKAKQNGK
jgi:HSP20 family protein